jgi:hypothetical protein
VSRHAIGRIGLSKRDPSVRRATPEEADRLRALMRSDRPEPMPRERPKLLSLTELARAADAAARAADGDDK